MINWLPYVPLSAKINVVYYNTPETLAELGTAVSQGHEAVLRQIEVIIRKYEQEKSAERSVKHLVSAAIYFSPDVSICTIYIVHKLALCMALFRSNTLMQNKICSMKHIKANNRGKIANHKSQILTLVVSRATSVSVAPSGSGSEDQRICLYRKWYDE